MTSLQAMHCFGYAETLKLPSDRSGMVAICLFFSVKRASEGSIIRAGNKMELSDLLYSKNGSNRWKTNSATAVNISRVTVNCFPVDVIIFAMLPSHGVWRETVSLLDVM